MRKRSPSLALIANKAGFSVSAVSLALRDSGRISEKTKSHVRRVASKLGYAPSPLVSAFMSHLRRKGGPAVHETIAYLYPFGVHRGYRSSLYYQEIEKAAKARAEAIGLHLERVPLPDPAIPGRPLDRILRNRGIRAVIVGPLAQPDGHLDLDWDRYSAVAVGHTLREPAIHRVAPDQFQGTMIVLNELSARGYRRIGLCLRLEQDIRAHHRFSAAYHWHSSQPGVGQPIPILTFSEPEKEDFLGWVKRYSLEVIVTSEPVLRWLQGAGYRVPRDIGLVHLTWSDRPYRCAGLDQVPSLLGAGAVEMIVGMLTLNEHGVPERPRTLTYGCVWRDGVTVRTRSPGAV